jgi:hypothetical protein
MAPNVPRANVAKWRRYINISRRLYLTLTDMPPIPGGFAASIAPSGVSGNGKLRAGA